MKNPFTLIALLLLVCNIHAGTNQSNKITNKNTTIKNVLLLHPEYSVYHVSDSLTKVFFSISSSELLYMKPSKTSDMMIAKCKIRYTILPSYSSTLVLDSSSIYFIDTLKNTTSQSLKILGSFTIPLAYSKVVVAELEMFDLNRGNDALSVVQINKKTNATRQNYLVENISDSLPLHTNFITTDDALRITYNKDKSVKQLFVKYYFGEYLLPPPPFSYQDRKPLNFTPDSIFKVNLDTNHQVIINFPKKGIYHFVTDSSSLEGLTLIRYNHSVPAFDDALEMLKAIRFITTKQEHDELMASDNLKAALDKYWLRCAQNNKDKARALIRNYYSRIEKANSYFSSFDEGWKTDRGLVFLIFGSPQVVTRDNFSETWVYGDDKNSMRQVRFVYTKVENPFTDNDYILNRSESYKEIWFRNVDAWRMGRVLNDN